MGKRNNDILGDFEQEMQASMPVSDTPKATPERQELQEWVKTTEAYAKCLEALKTVHQAIEAKTAELRDILTTEQQLSKDIKIGTPDFHAFSELVRKNNSKYGEVFRQELRKVAAEETRKIANEYKQEIADAVLVAKNEINVYVTHSQQRTEEVRRNNDVFTISWKRWMQLTVFYSSLLMLAGYLFHETWIKYPEVEILLTLNAVALLWDFWMVLLHYVVSWRRRK